MAATKVELFRSGNRSSANLHKPRLPGKHPRPEIDTFTDPKTGDEWVRANTGGVSTDEEVDPDWLGTPHRLPADITIPDELVLTPDGPGHWLWEPSKDMPLIDYLHALETINGQFEKVTA